MSFSLDDHIAKIPGFPKPDITFYDISPALENPAALSQTIHALTEKVRPMQPDITAGIDARGFLFAMPLALNVNLVNYQGRFLKNLTRLNMARRHSLSKKTAPFQASVWCYVMIC